MAEMSKTETRRFLMQGTFTGKLATVKKKEVLMLSQSGLWQTIELAKEV